MKSSETIRAVTSRRTVRAYTDKPLTKEEIDTLLTCAMLSPSARNRQPCRVRGIIEKDVLEELNTDFKNKVGWDTPAYTRWDVNPVYQTAPAMFFIFADDPAYMDAGIMVENMALAAKGLGLDSCIIGSIGALMNEKEGEKWKAFMGEPANAVFQIAIAVGTGSETPEVKPRKTENFTIHTRREKNV